MGIAKRYFVLGVLFVSIHISSAQFPGQTYWGPSTTVLAPKILLTGSSQDCLEWCWAACCQTMVNSLGFSVPQETFVRKLNGGALICRPAGPAEIMFALRNVYQSSDGSFIKISPRLKFPAQMNLDAILEPLARNQPFLLMLPGHAVSCYGVVYAELFQIYTYYDYYFGYVPYTVSHGFRPQRLLIQDPFYIFDRINHPQYNFVELSVYNPMAQVNGMISLETSSYDPPVITESPQSQTITFGSRLILHSSATGTAPLRYFWSLLSG